MRDKLGENNYNNRIIKHGPYDNLQILIPVDIRQNGFIDCSTRNPAWWTVHHIGEVLIQLFRYALINKIYFRGCISRHLTFKLVQIEFLEKWQTREQNCAKELIG